MARKVKAGRFKYSLDTVLKVRGIREKKEQEQFAEKKRDYLKEKEEEDALRRKKRSEEDTIRQEFKKGAISNFEKVMRRHAHLGILKKDIEEQVEKVIEASKILENQREKLVVAMKDKKIIEKDKEKTLEKYKKLMQDLELKFLDEIATQRYSRNKKKED